MICPFNLIGSSESGSWSMHGSGCGSMSWPGSGSSFGYLFIYESGSGPGSRYWSASGKDSK